jgi:RNA polymerase sigma-70 factor (ECF subfamily)
MLSKQKVQAMYQSGAKHYDFTTMKSDNETGSDLDFHGIYETFQPKIVGYLAHVVGWRDAEDLTQEVFVKVSQALKTFRGESQLSTWIYRIATNAALDKLRSPSFRQKGQKSLSGESRAEGEIEIMDRDAWTGEDTPSVETSMFQKEMNECIRGIVEKLPENYRTVVVLSELEGFRDEEIAEILGVSIHTAKIRLHRARTRLKRELETHCNFYRDERNEFACHPRETLRELKK